MNQVCLGTSPVCSISPHDTPHGGLSRTTPLSVALTKSLISIASGMQNRFSYSLRIPSTEKLGANKWSRGSVLIQMTG